MREKSAAPHAVQIVGVRSLRVHRVLAARTLDEVRVLGVGELCAAVHAVYGREARLDLSVHVVVHGYCRVDGGGSITRASLSEN